MFSNMAIVIKVSNKSVKLGMKSPPKLRNMKLKILPKFDIETKTNNNEKHNEVQKKKTFSSKILKFDLLQRNISIGLVSKNKVN